MWFYARASFLSHEKEIIWIPTPICHVYWNNHQKLSQFQAFWYRVFQTLLILNGRLDAPNNHKYMKFHIIITKYLVNVMLKACFKIVMIDRFNTHLKNKSHCFCTGVYIDGRSVRKYFGGHVIKIYINARQFIRKVLSAIPTHQIPFKITFLILGHHKYILLKKLKHSNRLSLT